MQSPDAHCETAREILGTIPLIMRVVAARLRQCDLEVVPAHYRTLKMLAEQSRSLSQLASMQHLRLPTISNTITSLEERGWVTRTRSQTDRRVILVALTPQGESALQVVHKHAESYIAGLLTAISEEEEETLRRGLATLHGVFEGALQSESTARSDIHHPG